MKIITLVFFTLLLNSCCFECNEDIYKIFSTKRLDSCCVQSGSYSWIIEDVPIIKKKKEDLKNGIVYSTYFQYSSTKNKYPSSVFWSFKCSNLNTFIDVIEKRKIDIEIEHLKSLEKRSGQITDEHNNIYTFDISYYEDIYDVTISYKYPH